jgi:hypothetical protein
LKSAAADRIGNPAFGDQPSRGIGHTQYLMTTKVGSSGMVSATVYVEGSKASVRGGDAVSPVNNIAMHVPVITKLIPNGEYVSVWSGNLVHVRIGETQYWMTATESVRGRVEAVVKVNDGLLKVRTVKPDAG